MAGDLQVSGIDWAAWKPTEYANLCFVMRDGKILLIRKKRGLGAGKINGPGGRLEPGETALAAAIRETQVSEDSWRIWLTNKRIVMLKEFLN